MEVKSIPAKAGKLLNAVASMGYDPEVALCDLIDNSIDAKSNNIKIHLEDNLDINTDDSDNQSAYVIADNGTGMKESDLINAFTLGSDRDYPSGSLGKFGLGLKSAGLSLGDRITLISKTTQGDIYVAILSIREVERTGDYCIEVGKATEEYIELWNKYKISPNSGTILIINELQDTQPTFSNFIAYFKRYCSNIYHLILESSELEIAINNIYIEGVDPLFEKEAREKGALLNPADWDGKSVHLLLDNQELNLDEGVNCTIMATHLIHPPSFEKDELRSSMRNRYQIEKDDYKRTDRHGFYIYRNNRIIVMAERFRGIISPQTQSWAFRGRLIFDESADKILHLDVKKRHMRLPATARNNLKHIIASYHTKSVNAWKNAGENYRIWKGEQKEKFANDSIANNPISNLDYNPGKQAISADDLARREALQIQLSQDTLKQISDKKINFEELNKRARENNSIVLSDGLKANAMWLPYAALELGKAEVLVNNYHSWIAEVINNTDSNPQLSLVVYQLIAVIARAELEIRTTPYDDISTAVLEKVFERFRRKASAIAEDLSEALERDLIKIKNGNIDEI